MGEKVVFTNCFFEKLCFAENTIHSVLENTAVAAKKCMLTKKQKIYEKQCLAF